MRKCLLVVFTAALTAMSFGAIKGKVIKTDGTDIAGEIKWSNRDKAYVIVRGGVEMQIPAVDVEDIEIVKPAGYDQAVALVEKGEGKKAISSLAKIVKEYRRLQWDKAAGGYLAQAYIQSGNVNEGLKVCQDIISADASAAYKGKLAPSYWEALLQLGQMTKLESALKKAAASGDRVTSGAALIKRGDVIMKEGTESTDAARKALIDGYLRVVMMYTDAGVAEEVRPEALYKAAQCFEKVGQAARADMMRKELRTMYKDSPWAAKQ